MRSVVESSLGLVQAVRLADCHDSMLGNSYKFSDRTDGILALSILLARGEGHVLAWHEMIKERGILAAIAFHHKMEGRPWHLRSQDSTSTRHPWPISVLHFSMVNHFPPH